VSAAHDTEGDAARDRVLDLLHAVAAQSRTVSFWWRDDDAEDATPQFDRLLVLAAKHAVPLALSVVPKRATNAMAERLADAPAACVLQHGWRHRNHSAEGEKKMELGPHRPVETMLDELAEGFDRLRARFAAKFLPVLVPPWNRIADEVRKRRREVGLIGLSTFGPAPKGEAHWANVHLDIIDWTARAPITRASAYAILSREAERRLKGDDEPLGIMTHHLVHHEANWRFLEELLDLIAGHPAVAWPGVADLFDLSLQRSRAETGRRQSSQKAG
jgi:peptidoglycan/xylan/chitin deacetylase (PgdA/CDA1 family)